jgi:hypothetical protein
VTTALPIPATADDLTPEWVTEMLSAAGLQGVRVRECASRPIGAGGSLASDVRVLRLSAEPGDGPDELVVKLASSGGELEAFTWGMYEREVAFYADFADIAGMSVPNCHYAAVDEAERRFCIVLERLRDGEPGDNDRGGTHEQLMRAAGALAPMHAAWWSEEGFEQPWMMQFGRVNRRMREMLPESVRMFEERYGSLVPGPLQELVHALPEWVEDQTERTGHSSRTFLHGDYSVKNLFFPESRSISVVAFDWALTGVGPGSRDLADLLLWSTDPATRRAAEEDVLHKYHSGLVSAGVHDYTVDECWNDYRRQVLIGLQMPVLNVGLPGASEARIDWARTVTERITAAGTDLRVVELL